MAQLRQFTEIEAYAILTSLDHTDGIALMDNLYDHWEMLEVNGLAHAFNALWSRLNDNHTDVALRYSENVINHVRQNTRRGVFRLDWFADRTPSLITSVLKGYPTTSKAIVTPSEDSGRLLNLLIIDATFMNKTEKQELRSNRIFNHGEIALWNWERLRMISVVMYRFTKQRQGDWVFTTEHAYGIQERKVRLGSCKICLSSGPLGRVCPNCRNTIFQLICVYAEDNGGNTQLVGLNSLFFNALFRTKVFNRKYLDRYENQWCKETNQARNVNFPHLPMSDFLLRTMDYPHLSCTLKFSDLIKNLYDNEDDSNETIQRKQICHFAANRIWRMEDLRNEEWVRFHRFVSEMDVYWYNGETPPDTQVYKTLWQPDTNAPI